jgi:hypothetical protein
VKRNAKVDLLPREGGQVLPGRQKGIKSNQGRTRKTRLGSHEIDF